MTALVGLIVVRMTQATVAARCRGGLARRGGGASEEGHARARWTDAAAAGRTRTDASNGERQEKYTALSKCDLGVLRALSLSME